MAKREVCLHDVGQRIRACRNRLGLTQEELAERSGVTTQFISYAETGQRAPRPENLLSLSDALQVSADYLLTGEIIDRDQLRLSQKLDLLSADQFRIVESIIDECVRLFPHASSTPAGSPSDPSKI